MLKAIFGVTGLLLVLAIVASLGKTQLQALGQLGQPRTPVPAPAGSGSGDAADAVAARAVGGHRLDGFGATAGAEVPSAQAQIQGVQQSARDRTTEALQQGLQRSQRTVP